MPVVDGAIAIAMFSPLMPCIALASATMSVKLISVLKHCAMLGTSVASSAGSFWSTFSTIACAMRRWQAVRVKSPSLYVLRLRASMSACSPFSSCTPGFSEMPPYEAYSGTSTVIPPSWSTSCSNPLKLTSM